MTKKELGDLVAKRANFFKRDTYELLDVLIDIITETLASGEKITISRLITLEPIYVPKRRVRNPKHNTVVTQQGHTRIKVKISPVLKALVNGEEVDKNDER